MIGREPDGAFTAERPLALGFGGVAVLVVGVLVLGAALSISGAVVATGWVAVENRNQAVEHADGGTVREILVRDGDRVERDAVLLRFADGLLRREEAILVAQYAELASRRNRLEAEFRGREAIDWDGQLTEMAAGNPTVRDILDGQERLFRARARAHGDETARLRERIGQARDEIAGLEAQAGSLREQSALIAQELEVQRSLLEDGLALLPRMLALERAAKSLEGRSGETAAAIARVQGRIAELEIQILQIDSRRIKEAEEQARDVSVRENQIRERLAATRDRLARTEVRAPVAGEVFGMSVFAPGEVVGPGEPILSIVPDGARPVVVARINPTDVDQVYPGQPAVLRFSAFPARETPELDGRVVRVSADAVRDGRTGLAWYEVELAVNNAPQAGAAHRAFGGLPVLPGMPVEAYIRTGERSLLSYFAKPVTDFFHRSLREE